MSEQQTLNVGIGISPEATPETAGAIRTALLTAFIQLSQSYLASTLEPSIARLALQWIPQEAPPEFANLESLRQQLLAPRIEARNEWGWLNHPNMPVMDEGTNIAKFLEAFGLEVHFGSMESDRPEFHERWCDEGLDNCSEWVPERPAGEGWILLEIYPGEDDNWALFVRCAYEAERERKDEQRASRRRAYESTLQTALTLDGDA